jgi:molybdopterin synthase catalytic subunit
MSNLACRNASRTSDKIVTRLEYQAYTPLAMKTMSRILTEAHSLHAPQSNSTSTTALQPSLSRTPQKSLLKSVVVHRLGSVPVGQTSVIIAVSSPHRREAFEACEWILERVKKDVQVWKREWYARDASAVPGKGMVKSGPAVCRDGEAGVMGMKIETNSAWKENS